MTNMGSWTAFLGKLGVTHDLGRSLVGKPKVDFLFALIELSSLSVTVPELWGEMCTSRLFSQGSTSLHSNFTWIRSSPISYSWRQKTTDTGLPDGEDCILLCSLILTQYRTMLMLMLMYSIYPRANLVTKSYDSCAMRVIPGCDGRTDRRTDLP